MKSSRPRDETLGTCGGESSERQLPRSRHAQKSNPAFPARDADDTTPLSSNPRERLSRQKQGSKVDAPRKEAPIRKHAVTFTRRRRQYRRRKQNKTPSSPAMPSSHSDPDPNSKIQVTSKLDIQNEYLHEKIKDPSTGQVKVTEKVAPHQSTATTTLASNPVKYEVKGVEEPKVTEGEAETVELDPATVGCDTSQL